MPIRTFCKKFSDADIAMCGGVKTDTGKHRTFDVIRLKPIQRYVTLKSQTTGETFILMIRKENRTEFVVINGVKVYPLEEKFEGKYE